MKSFIGARITFRKINRNIWLLPNQNSPIFGIRDLFQSDQSTEKKDHTRELLTSYKKFHIPEPKIKIEEDDYDLLSCPPENLIHPQKKTNLETKKET
jgi:hypothetical protein